MKFLLTSFGTRGDVEPFAAVGRELEGRGHEVCLAVSPNLVDFAESAGLAAVACGLDSRAPLEAQRKFRACLAHHPWRVRDLSSLWHDIRELLTQYGVEMSPILMSLAKDADVLVTGFGFEQVAANVAEHHGIPLATLHFVPVRANGQLVPSIPAPLMRSAARGADWLSWRTMKKVEDAQRRELGLPKTTGPLPRRISDKSLEIQAYDEACFPGLAAEWATFDGRRPFVGAITMQMPTDADEEVLSWIAAGTPPIFFGFGSLPVESPAATLAIISAACAQLGERALVCAGWSDFSDLPHSGHVKVVGAVNFAAILPTCRAIVHHGGSGTTAAGLRAGVPTLILWMDATCSIWAAQLKRLKVGAGRRFTSTTQQSLVADLRKILNPQYVARAREISTRMTKPEESVTMAADHLENFARPRNVG
ncbi:glycosyl transferase family 1 [Mycolicibacterium sp. GF69]|uniref:glycosyltransferase n=1 Tax=Mycolicibacterium sp. GF69 TaxID=2267251 RepID=UPI000DCBA4A7|nr:glycosyltransferase [Mycolicibacterium sp. GF69]RAV13559.1 glycosyl transferase family 1 [Mycolicibacterium sp. GF69]